MNTAIVGLSLIENKLHDMPVCPEKEYLIPLTNDVKVSCTDAVKILTGILDYEKLGAGLMTLEQTWVKPISFFLAALRPFKMVADSKRIQLIIDTSSVSAEDRDSYVMFIDEVKIAQVVRNYVSNAIKFSPPEGTVQVAVKMMHNFMGHYIRFEVMDTGPGIASADIGKVFNEVVQFNANTQQGGGGSGIGLWICKKILDLHGGRVFVESREGQGCTFAFELGVIVNDVDGRITLRDAASYRSNSPSKDAGATRPNNFTLSRSQCQQQLNILVVDDSQLNRKMMVRLLEGLGHSCSQAGNGKEAVTVYKSLLENEVNPMVQVILMDNNMPLMSGGEATAILRADGYKGLIIGVTGDALQSDLDDFIRCGLDAVLTKPIDPVLFNKVLCDLQRDSNSTIPI